MFETWRRSGIGKSPYCLTAKTLIVLSLKTAHIGWAGRSASDLGSLTERWGGDKS